MKSLLINALNEDSTLTIYEDFCDICYETARNYDKK